MEDIYTGNGVSELINLCMQALLNDGDEILIPSPDYPLWTATATLAGGNVVHYICDEQSDWYPDIDGYPKEDYRSEPKPSLSSTPTIPRERCIPGRFWRRSSRLPGSMS
ncbi:MAG: aminotransferase class I/II-fold pyridoxal phosphate-dependent enzyme [Lachnospiraceae bacterium]